MERKNPFFAMTQPLQFLVSFCVLASWAVVSPALQAQTLTVLHEFLSGAHDGQSPIYGSLILDEEGNLYGVTALGGSGSCSGGCGTLFKLTPSHKFTVIYAFGANANDGRYPEGSLIRDAEGNFYGVTNGGGSYGEEGCAGYGCGTVYVVTPEGKETVLYSFSGGTDGASPTAGLVRDSGGTLYGTTWMGGAYNWGTVFAVNTLGQETVLHNFDGAKGDGGLLIGGLITDSAGNFYGTTFGGGNPGCFFGGQIGCGTIFKLSPSGEETILYKFSPNLPGGDNPEEERLLLDTAGNLYGTDNGPGPGYVDGLGTIFKLDTSGNLTVLHAFTGGVGGAGSVAGVIADSAGNLYGTSDLGGGTSCINGGCGIAFELATDGTFTTLHSFEGSFDGAEPWGLVMDGAGNLYGDTDFRGLGDGSVYEISP